MSKPITVGRFILFPVDPSKKFKKTSPDWYGQLTLSNGKVQKLHGWNDTLGDGRNVTRGRGGDFMEASSAE